MNESATHVQKGEIKYLILGCGNLGYHIIQELFPEISKILVIDNNEDRVKELRDQKVNAMVRELDDPGLVTNNRFVPTRVVRDKWDSDRPIY